MSGDVSLADVAAVTRNNNDGGFGGDGWWGAIILFALIFGWGGNGFGGGFGGRAGEQPVTESGLCNAMNFNNLENAVGRLNDQQQAQFTQLTNGICNLGYETLSNFNATQRQLADCCCTTQRGIDSVNYNGAMNTAAINANVTEQTQKILDAICQNRMADMQSKIQQLELNQAMTGVVRYPSGFTFTAGPSPFCNSGYGCGCNGNI